MHRNPSVSSHQFAMVPKSDIPRSRFAMQKTYKTTFNAGLLIPILVEEVLPGDTYNVKSTHFARLSTPLKPFMDNLHYETFFFFVPNRLTWANWVKFMGEQDQPGDSISYTIPVTTSPVGGWPIGSIADYMGLPTVGQVGAGATVTHSCLPMRCYELIWNKWFRDENLVTAYGFSNGDGPDSAASWGNPSARGKRHDYFTSCLPWVQKGNTPVTIPLAGTATIKTLTPLATQIFQTTAGVNVGQINAQNAAGSTALFSSGTGGATAGVTFRDPVQLYADLTTATGATINQLRQSFQIQKLLERDARGGTRYTEIVRSHFGVMSPDARLQRPEYLGGGSTPISVNAIAQTSASAITGSTTPVGNLAAMGQMVGHGHGFTQSFTEHGYIIGLACVRADLTYQQGMRRHWSRSTRYDFYFPAFAMLGEQAVLNQEIYCVGTPAQDTAVFGYQERWAEYRYNPSEITGLFRSTAAGTLDFWHLAQKFTALPTLNSTFILEAPPIARAVAVPSEPNFLLDIFYDMKVARPLPLYSVPGLIDHF
ncbi:MAG: major capsid protein [Microvirus sp.]|nr:MAG: major capsid protein [Microvirus sp.]